MTPKHEGSRWWRRLCGLLRGGAGDVPADGGAAPQEAWERGLALHREGRLDEAEAVYRDLLEQQPGTAEVLHTLGVLQAQRGQLGEAELLMEQAIRSDPGHVTALVNRGNLLRALGRAEEALASYDLALVAAPEHDEARRKRCATLMALGRMPEALAGYERILGELPDDLEALFNRGVVLATQDRFPEAVAAYDRALAVKPDFVEVLNNRGIALWKSRQCEAAIVEYDRALAVRPDYAEAHYNRGIVLAYLRRFAEALESYDRAVACNPGYAEAFSNRGTLQADIGQFEAALINYDRALEIRPEFTEALNNRGGIFRKMGLHERAAQDYSRLLEINPEYEHAAGNKLYSDAWVCNWNRFIDSRTRLLAAVREGLPVALPFQVAVLSDSAEEQLACSKAHVARKYPGSAKPLWSGEQYRHDRIRVAYLSADFRDHATTHLMIELFEKHDQSRFDVSAWSFGPDVQDAMRTRLQKAFGQFNDVRNQSDMEIATLLRAREIDIAVDLKGFTDGCRPAIFAWRAAPIQVNYLGYPGTTGADYMDYIIGDLEVIPQDHDRFYTEKVVRLPDSYQVNDSGRVIAEQIPSHAEAGLPETGFVFCCFNNNYKITPDVFDVWMRLLKRVEGSVLWLLEDNAAASRNLRLEAEARGVRADRLVFAPRMLPPDHLARHRLADLFLDTLPCNAHTTASDALWAGLPLLTCRGHAFAGRVAASLLRAMGLPELIAETLADYEALALKLATTPALLAGIKSRLAQNRTTQPLFDIDRYRLHIESAYVTMYERYQRSELPQAFSVKVVPR